VNTEHFTNRVKTQRKEKGATMTKNFENLMAYFVYDGSQSRLQVYMTWPYFLVHRSAM
jgi:hypothetical protein